MRQKRLSVAFWLLCSGDEPEDIRTYVMFFKSLRIVLTGNNVAPLAVFYNPYRPVAFSQGRGGSGEGWTQLALFV